MEEITKIYIENVKESIKRNIIWSNSDGHHADPVEFLDNIISYCEKLKNNPPQKKKHKTRHGSGRKS